jgi:hypothetical protein
MSIGLLCPRHPVIKLTLLCEIEPRFLQNSAEKIAAVLVLENSGTRVRVYGYCVYVQLDPIFHKGGPGHISGLGVLRRTDSEQAY